MDILHKNLSQIGDSIYFLISSVEEPYYWLRMKGEIMEISASDTIITYRIRLNEILESIEIIRNYICWKHYRIRSIKKKQKPFLDYYIKSRIDIPDERLVSFIVDQMKNRWFDVSIMTTFDTEQKMNDRLSIVNKHNIDILSKRIDFLSKRNLEL